MVNKYPSSGNKKLKLNMENSEVSAAKRKLQHTTTDNFLIKYTVNKKFLFMINRIYVTYKPGYYVTYEDQREQRQLRLEEWTEIEKEISRLTRTASVKNNICEGESLKLNW